MLSDAFRQFWSLFFMHCHVNWTEAEALSTVKPRQALWHNWRTLHAAWGGPCLPCSPGEVPACPALLGGPLSCLPCTPGGLLSALHPWGGPCLPCSPGEAPACPVTLGRSLPVHPWGGPCLLLCNHREFPACPAPLGGLCLPYTPGAPLLALTPRGPLPVLHP